MTPPATPPPTPLPQAAVIWRRRNSGWEEAGGRGLKIPFPALAFQSLKPPSSTDLGKGQWEASTSISIETLTRMNVQPLMAKISHPRTPQARRTEDVSLSEVTQKATVLFQEFIQRQKRVCLAGWVGGQWEYGEEHLTSCTDFTYLLQQGCFTTSRFQNPLYPSHSTSFPRKHEGGKCISLFAFSVVLYRNPKKDSARCFQPLLISGSPNSWLQQSNNSGISFCWKFRTWYVAVHSPPPSHHNFSYCSTVTEEFVFRWYAGNKYMSEKPGLPYFASSPRSKTLQEGITPGKHLCFLSCRLSLLQEVGLGSPHPQG